MGFSAFDYGALDRKAPSIEALISEVEAAITTAVTAIEAAARLRERASACSLCRVVRPQRVRPDLCLLPPVHPPLKAGQ
jgi:hypothetical protein